MSEIRNKPTWETLAFPELVVGEATRGFHPGDTAYWRYINHFNKLQVISEEIHMVGSDGIIYLGREGALGFGLVVKISCPHNSKLQFIPTPSSPVA